MKKVLSSLFAGILVVSMGVGLAGCASSNTNSGEVKNTESTETKSTETKEVTEVEMKYTSVDDAKAKLDDSNTVFVDVRKADDFKAGHIKGSVSADMDAAKGGDNEAGLDAMQKAIDSNNLKNQNLILVCYSGKSYAQAGTNILNALGYDMSKVTTLEGGIKAWEEAGLDKVTN